MMAGIAWTNPEGLSGMVFRKEKKHSICIISSLILVLLHEHNLYTTLSFLAFITQIPSSPFQSLF